MAFPLQSSNKHKNHCMSITGLKILPLQLCYCRPSSNVSLLHCRLASCVPSISLWIRQCSCQQVQSIPIIPAPGTLSLYPQSQYPTHTPLQIQGCPVPVHNLLSHGSRHWPFFDYQLGPHKKGFILVYTEASLLTHSHSLLWLLYTTLL